jgi:DNA topoisomerase I
MALAEAEAARDAGLRYVSDRTPGIRRRRAGGAFAYTGPDGRPVRDAETLDRIRRLAVPPAWSDVWICPRPSGHIQATGRDARGRKQYRYHAEWRRVRDEAKFERLAAFGRALPAIRARVAADLGRHALDRERVVAAVVRLLDMTLIRVGNEEYARQNASFGLTTLRDRHVRVRGTRLLFQFRGKSGRQVSVEASDRRLALLVRRLQDLPGQVLFQYRDDGRELRVVESDDVNEYLTRVAGQACSARDFRTWGATVLMYRALAEAGPPGSEREARRAVNERIALVAGQLGNTPAVLRQSYLHPAVVEAYAAGDLAGATQAPPIEGLRTEERALLCLLENLIV